MEPLPSSKNWLLLLSYDGFNYHGWQIQKHQNTIEAELESAVFKLTGKETAVCGAGRTDSKVHALNQTANFLTETNFTADKWRNALNGVLPSDISVKSALSIPLSFHARHSALGKRYRYLIFNKPFSSPFANHYSWWVRKPLDVDAMSSAIPYFIGEHDFSAFRSSQCSSPSPLKTLRDLTIRYINTPNANICIEVEANSFLQHMVRIIVGTLVAIGEHKILPQDIPHILKSKDRQKSGKTAPPYGLYVLKVYYPDFIQWPADVFDF